MNLLLSFRLFAWQSLVFANKAKFKKMIKGLFYALKNFLPIRYSQIQQLQVNLFIFMKERLIDDQA
jgi:hypothetical protein